MRLKLHRRRRAGIVLVSLLFVSVGFAGTGEEEAPESDGLLNIRTHAPGYAFRYVPTPRVPRNLAPGQMRAVSQFSVSSIFVDDGAADQTVYKMDFYMRDLAAGLMVGLPGGLSGELMFRERRPINAHLDRFIMNFHDAFGYEQNGRENAPKDDFRIAVPPHDVDLGKEFMEPFRRTLEGTLQQTVCSETESRPAIALGATAALLIYDGYYSEAGDVEGSIHAGATKRWGRHFAHAALAWSWFASRDPIAIPFKDNLWTGTIGWEWRPKTRHALLLEYMLSEGAVAGLGQLARPSNEIRLGYRLRQGAFALELGAVENLKYYGNSADIAFHIGLSYDL
ncbi:MAG: DUF3187 family protein [Kiritimatiellae bacterium]|nr:DUF3187 family protein [Kiritimatiellia bacterium]